MRSETCPFPGFEEPALSRPPYLPARPFAPARARPVSCTGRGATLNETIKTTLVGYVDRVSTTLKEANAILEEVKTKMDTLQLDYKGPNAKIDMVKKCIAKNKFFFDKKSKLQAIHLTLTQAKSNLDFIIKLVDAGTVYNPTDVITDREGRYFWQKYFGMVRSQR